MGYQEAFAEIVHRFPSAQCLLLSPPPVWRDGALGIDQVVVNTILPDLLRTTAADLGCEYVSVYQAFRDGQARPPGVTATHGKTHSLWRATDHAFRRPPQVAEDVSCDGVHVSQRGQELIMAPVRERILQMPIPPRPLPS